MVFFFFSDKSKKLNTWFFKDFKELFLKGPRLSIMGKGGTCRLKGEKKLLLTLKNSCINDLMKDAANIN